MPRRVTMQEVAAKAGVSASTVSRALGNDPRIAAATKTRIQKLATKLGYRPDPLLSALARRRRRGGLSGAEVTTLALVTNYRTADWWRTNPFYSAVFLGAIDHAARNGYRIEEFWLGEPGMTGPRLGRILHNRGIVGVVVAPTPVARSRMDLDWDRFSAVTIGYSLVQPDLHRVTPHHFHALLAADRRLRRLGYTRIGFCIFEGTSGRVDDLWLSAALLTARSHPDSPIKIFLFNDDTRSRIPDWALEERLEVIISDNPEPLEELRARGIRAPGQIDFATLNWTKTDPDIAGIDQLPSAIGAAAIDLLIAQIRRNERGVPAIPVTSMVEGSWVNGHSISRRPRPA